MIVLSDLVKSKDPCFICLEDEKNSLGEDLLDSSTLRGCGCKFMVHPSCWDLWAQTKTDFDCPICGKYILEVIGHSPKVEDSSPFPSSFPLENVIQNQYDNFEETMKKYNLRNVFHLEIDNLVYFKVEELLENYFHKKLIIIP